jgi:hypothetical protein
MLRALLWKDFRLNRLPLLIGIALLVVPYFLVSAAVMNMPLWEEATKASAWAVLLTTGCHFSVMCSQASLAMLTGHVIAAERGDRSAEFLAYLPPTRGQILVSKGILVAGTSAIVWGTNLGLQSIANLLAGDTDPNTLTANMAALSELGAIGIVACGAGWCASAMLDNSGPAVGLALVAPMALFGFLELGRYLVSWPNELSFSHTYFAACWPTGIGLFLAGTVYYLQRVEP